MASTNQFLITLAIVAVILPMFTSATEFTVGDKSGWTNDFDYDKWAKDKEFYVGDTLVFNYSPGKHNVFIVNGTVFHDCAIPNSNDAHTSGNDKILLATEGKNWYFCGIADHCKGGQKLKITVWPAAPAPAPNSANGISNSGLYILFSAIISLAVMVNA